MNKCFILAVFLALPALAAPTPWKCQEGTFRVSQGAKKVESTEKFCLRKPLQLLSQNCEDMECELLSKIKAAPDSAFLPKSSEEGNPGFKICRSLGGIPRIIEYKEGKAWKPFNECRFAKDGSFANVDFLFYMAKRERPWL